MARIGEIVDGKYEILREIGRGGMSVVYLAMDKRLNKQWAIKEFRKDKDDASKQVALKALLDEANLMKKLDHPTLPRIVDIINLQTSVYIVMDYIEGESLNKVLDSYGAQPQEAVIEWAKQLSDVLDYLHTQNPPVIYRDMKPANIMLKPDGTVRLIDFGIAREYKEGKAGDTEAIGTRGYAAPEQFGGRGQTDARTDIYSLGVTLYHLVTGQNPAEPPYEIYPIRHWNPSLSSGLEWLIQKCTQLNPGDRYQSCAEVSYVLNNLEKFEGEYKRKQRTKINLFVISAILTLVFALLSVFCFIGNSMAESQNIDALMEKGTVEAYAEVIELHPDHAEAYMSLADTLRGSVTKIVPGDGGEENLSDSVICYQDLYTWFGNLDTIKESNPQTYIKVNYEIGRLLWNYYVDDTSNDETAGIKEAYKYFVEVIDTYKKNEDNPSIGLWLDDAKYELATAYCGVGIFVRREGDIQHLDDGSLVLSETEKQVLHEFGFESNNMDYPYMEFWHVCEELIDIILNNSEMKDVVRTSALDKFAVILNRNYTHFKYETKDTVTATDMKNVFEKVQMSIDKIPVSNDNKNELDAIAKTYNDTVKSINALYETDIEDIKVGEVQ